MKKFLKITSLFLLISFMIFAETVKIDIVTFNDFHGNVTEGREEMGMSKLVAYVKSIKAENPNTIVVSGGDNYQGTAMSNLTLGLPVNEMIKLADLEASAIGNHEFDWGTDKIENWAKEGNFDFLASNIYEKETGKSVEWAKPYKIVEKGGKKIALIGFSTRETPYATKAEYVKDLKFELVEKAAKEWVEFLLAGKAKEGKPDLIVALTHVPSSQDEDTKKIMGEEIEKLSLVDGIDIIVSGHSHQVVAGFLNGKAVVQAGKYGRGIGRIKVNFEDNGDKKIDVVVDDVSKTKDEIIEDKEAKVLYEKQNAELAEKIEVVLGKLDEDMTHDRDGKNLTKLGYWTSNVTRKAVNVQIGLLNGGGVRRTLYKGNITTGDMYEIVPFDNTLVTMKVKGIHLKALIEHGLEADFMTDGQFAGVKVVYDDKKPYGERLVALNMEDGTAVDDMKEYTIVVNDFMAGGGDRYDFNGARNIVNTYITMRDVLSDDVKKEGTVKVPNIDGMVRTLADFETYEIKSGDVLGKIAEKYDVSLEELGAINGIEDYHKIRVGQDILVPAE